MTTLTIGELSKLFNLSKYTIRHYIDKEILTPKRNQENKYYVFEEGDIYRLYQIKTLRDIGFSIKEIQKCLELDDIKSMFEEAEIKIQQEINNLLETQKAISKIVTSQKKHQLNHIIFVEHEERYFKKVKKQMMLGDSIDYSKVVEYKALNFEEPYVILAENQPEIMCLRSAKECNDYVFPQGTYASMSFVVENKADIEKQVRFFKKDLVVRKRQAMTEHFLLYENIYCSLSYTDKMVYSIEVKL